MKKNKNGFFWNIVIVILLVVGMFINYSRDNAALVGNEDGAYEQQAYYQTQQETDIRTKVSEMWQEISSVQWKADETQDSNDVFNRWSNYQLGSDFAFKDHVYARKKGNGICRTLTGDVLVNVIFVDDFDATWNAQDTQSFKNKQDVEIDNLMKQAAEKGVYLNITTKYTRANVEGSVSMQKSLDWANDALKSCCLPKGEKAVETLKKEYGVDEAAIVFAVNRAGRAFAMTSETKNSKTFEYAIVYDDASGFAHEVCHLFGAVDFYLPATTKGLAEQYFPNSLMLKSSSDGEVDDLTAYLIGWETQLSDSANSFMKQTSWMDREYLNKIAKEDQKTGRGTYQWTGATYTGDLVDGVPHGTGKIVWHSSGIVYEGEVEQGVATRGVYTYPDGTTRTIG